MAKLNLSDICKTIGKEIVYSAQIYIPISKKTKNRIIGSLQEKAEEIIPLMSKRTGFNLSPVKIKPHYKRLQDIMKHLNAWDRSKIACVIGWPIANVISMLQEDLANMSYEPKGRVAEPSVYVCFGMGSKLTRDVYDPRERERSLVHELSHHLWFSVAGEQGIKDFDEGKFREYRLYKLWVEGFAAHCEAKVFWDLYANSPGNIGDKAKIYREGNKLIEGAIAEAGEDILFQLPLRWREFRHLSI